MGKRKRVIAISAILTVMLALLLGWGIWYGNKADDTIELPEGNLPLSYRHLRQFGDLHLFINRNGELRCVVKDNQSLRNKANLVLEEYSVNDFSRSFLGTEVIKYEPKPLYLFDDGKIHLSETVLTIEELEKLLLQHKRKYGKEARVAIFADKDVPHSKVRPVIDIMRKVGIYRIAFAATARKKDRLMLFSLELMDNDDVEVSADSSSAESE